MATQGPNPAGVGANTTGVGTVAWVNPGNIVSSNGVWSEAFCSAGGVTSNWLKATSFGFSIPSGATIDGITVAVEGHFSSLDEGLDNAVRIVKGGTIGSTDKGRGGATFWAAPTNDATWNYGGAADLWGETWTDTDINASNFGFVISGVVDTGGSGSFLVDYITITINYTAAGGGQTFRPDADTTTTGWVATPLFSKVNETSADGTVITSTAS